MEIESYVSKMSQVRISRRQGLRLLLGSAAAVTTAAMAEGCGPENDPAQYTINTDGYANRPQRLKEMFAKATTTRIVLKTDITDTVIRTGQAAFQNDTEHRLKLFHPTHLTYILPNEGFLHVHLPEDHTSGRTTLMRAAIISPEHGELIIESVKRISVEDSSFADSVPPEDRKHEALEFHFRDKLNEQILKNIVEDGITVYVQEIQPETYQPVEYANRVLNVSVSPLNNTSTR